MEILAKPKLLAIAVLASGAAQAEYIDHHRCRPPFEDPFPNSFSRLSYQMELSSYKDCIKKYVEEQKLAAQSHQEAAAQAIKEWNDYVDRIQK